MIVSLDAIEKMDFGGKKTGLSHGCFDFLHAGHLEHFALCKKHCDILVVSITPDRYVRKGPGRPYYNQQQRAEMVDMIDLVDYVVCDDTGETAVTILDSIKPYLYFKGIEYRETKDLTDNIHVERESVERHGGSIAFLSGRIFSSTSALKQINNVPLAPFSLPPSELEPVFDNMQKMRVAVIGETIVDKYIKVETLGVANKYPVLSTKYVSERSDFGGAYAIYLQTKEFCDAVDLYSSNNFLSHDVTKVRYVDVHKGNKLFEINEGLGVQPGNLPDLSNYDLVLICDFGHGAFTDEVIQQISSCNTKFIALMCQCNTANQHSNFIKKYNNIGVQYIVLNRKEGISNSHDSDPDNAIYLLRDLMHCDICITLGQQGAMMLTDGGLFRCPSVHTSIVDTIGCGDAFFLTSSLARVSGCDPIVSLKLGNVVSYLYAQFDGNSEKVSRNDVFRFSKGLQ